MSFAYSDLNEYYSGNSVGAYFYKNIFLLAQGNYFWQHKVTNNNTDGTGIASQTFIEQDARPVWIHPSKTENSSVIRNTTFIDNYAPNQTTKTNIKSEITSIYLSPVAINTKTKIALYAKTTVVNNLVVVDNVEQSQLQSVVVTLIFARVNEPEPLAQVKYTKTNFDIEETQATLIGTSLFLVPPPIGDDKYDTGFWEGKTSQYYAEQPNVFDYPDFTKPLTDVPVMKVSVDSETQKLQIKDDVIVDKVLPLLEGATVLAASYYPT